MAQGRVLKSWKPRQIAPRTKRSLLLKDPRNYRPGSVPLAEIQERNRTQIINLCQAVLVLGEVTPRVQDAIASAGERVCVYLLLTALEAQEVKRNQFRPPASIRTDDHFTDAHPNMAATRELVRSNLLPLLEKGCVPVITGFLAANDKGTSPPLGQGRQRLFRRH